jgi:hypothetical protein
MDGGWQAGRRAMVSEAIIGNAPRANEAKSAAVVTHQPQRDGAMPKCAVLSDLTVRHAATTSHFRTVARARRIGRHALIAAGFVSCYLLFFGDRVRF